MASPQFLPQSTLVPAQQPPGWDLGVCRGGLDHALVSRRPAPCRREDGGECSQHRSGLRFAVHLDIHYLWQLSGGEQVTQLR